MTATQSDLTAKQSNLTDTLPMQGMSRIKTVCKFTGLSKSTIYNWVQAGKFPKPIKLSKTMSVWRNSDVLDWINNPAGASDASDITTPATATRQ